MPLDFDEAEYLAELNKRIRGEGKFPEGGGGGGGWGVDKKVEEEGKVRGYGGLDDEENTSTRFSEEPEVGVKGVEWARRVEVGSRDVWVA